MPAFSTTSLNRLASCDARLQAIFAQVILLVDCMILEGFRDQAAQDAAFAAGRSKLRWPHGAHNRMPSRAVDAAPLPIDWADRERLHLFAGVVLGVAHAQGVALRWGGDWNRNFAVADNRFDDLVHFELVED